MNILAIECSTSHASLCLAGAAAFSCDWIAERNHDAHLFPALQEALERLGERNLDVILVGSGPGSYGGVRVALAAATGVAVVRDCRIAPMCSWEALAEGRAGIISDAKRGGWTLRRPTGEITVLDAEGVQQAIRDGELLWSTESPERLSQAGISVPRAGLVPTAQGLVEVWECLSEDERARRVSQPAEPIYVRPPHITTPKRKPWEINK